MAEAVQTDHVSRMSFAKMSHFDEFLAHQIGRVFLSSNFTNVVHAQKAMKAMERLVPVCAMHYVDNFIPCGVQSISLIRLYQCGPCLEGY